MSGGYDFVFQSPVSSSLEQAGSNGFMSADLSVHRRSCPSRSHNEECATEARPTIHRRERLAMRVRASEMPPRSHAARSNVRLASRIEIRRSSNGDQSSQQEQASYTWLRELID